MPRILLLLPTTTYRTKAFIDAALNLNVEVVAASERPSTLAEKNPAGLLTLTLSDPHKAAREVFSFAEQYKIDAVIPVDEDTAVVAANIANALGLKHNSIESCEKAKNKYLMRLALKQANVPVPRFRRFTFENDIDEISAEISYPAVIKPVFLSTSRGVMRIDQPSDLSGALDRLKAILKLPEISKRGGASARDVLAEEFIPGDEVAVEGLLLDGRLKVLAIFDKPDPLNGPFFEETIYVTPSRFSQPAQDQIGKATAAAARAMGLTHGPVHAELRINDRGPWVIEVAARAIGGLCSRALRFTGGASLEELIIRHAVGEEVDSFHREHRASGVMMIPIPRSGVLREIRGLDQARSTEGVEEVIISAHVTQRIAPPPEGASYLGFIFSRGDAAEDVESALRRAHQSLEFVIV